MHQDTAGTFMESLEEDVARMEADRPPTGPLETSKEDPRREDPKETHQDPLKDHSKEIKDRDHSWEEARETKQPLPGARCTTLPPKERPSVPDQETR